MIYASYLTRAYVAYLADYLNNSLAKLFSVISLYVICPGFDIPGNNKICYICLDINESASLLNVNNLKVDNKEHFELKLIYEYISFNSSISNSITYPIKSSGLQYFNINFATSLGWI